MTPEDALSRSTSYLDEATENLTFDAFQWAFEEAWLGVAWALNALHAPPLASMELIDDGLPRPGTLRALLASTPSPPRPAATIVATLERLAAAVHAAPAPSAAVTARAHEVEEAVFATWPLHDAVSLRLGVVDERLGDGIVLADPSPGRVGSRLVGRRDALKLLLAASVVPLQACKRVDRDNSVPEVEAPAEKAQAPAGTPKAPITAITAIRGTLWPVSDPFLFCAYHNDAYPVGNADLGPAASLEGRNLGRDFTGKDNWRMYHGRTVPGFPRHPHRGFETVTVVRSGLLDHSDSMGATARYGGGDVQWLTAGRGIQHAEMFPLVKQDAPNPLELYQIWLNLPARDKMVPPHFTMLWEKTIPKVVERDAAGKQVTLTLSAGAYKAHTPPPPPPNSWASRPEAEVAIWTIQLEPGARFTLPTVSRGTKRSLYVRDGEVRVNGQAAAVNHRVEVDEPGTLAIEAGARPADLLLLQGRPIGEPVAKRGPFVMNTQDEIRQAYVDYRSTQFGGWPWEGNGPVHAHKERFAIHIDGRTEKPG